MVTLRANPITEVITMESLDSVRAEVQGWRAAHPRQGRRFPVELKQRVASLIDEVDVGDLARALHMSATQLQRWKAVCVVSGRKHAVESVREARSQAAAAFIEIPLPATVRDGNIELEVELSQTRRFVVRGRLDTALVQGIVTAVCQTPTEVRP